MNGPRHDEYPVLPDEAKDLDVHVTQCARRYNALLRVHYEIFKMVRRQSTLTWIYRAITLPLLGVIAVELWKLIAKFP